jgi:ABC-type antimicrobial peptide transport system permease subunit
MQSHPLIPIPHLTLILIIIHPTLNPTPPPLLIIHPLPILPHPLRLIISLLFATVEWEYVFWLFLSGWVSLLASLKLLIIRFMTIPLITTVAYRVASLEPPAYQPMC